MATSAASRILPALLLVTTGCAAIPSSTEQAAGVPEPPPVVEGVPDPIPAPPDDGLHRFVVWPPTPIATPTPTPTPARTPVEDGDATPGTDPIDGAEDGAVKPPVAPPPDPAWTLDQSLVDRIDDDTVVVFEDGVPGFHDPDGVFVPLVGNSTASSGTPVPRTGGQLAGGGVTGGDLTGQDFVDGLLDIEGVLSAVAIGDGSFAVVAEEADTLDGRGLDPVVDTPFALAADPYEYYQWTLDNDGTNLNGLQSPPSQSVDADIDGLEAKVGARGQGVVVAVIDTGVDFSHPDLVGQSWVNDDEICTNLIDDDDNGFVDDCNGWDFGNEDNQPYGGGQQEHGTHVAGTIAAVADNGVGVVGMAPDARIMDLNVEGPGGMTMSGISRAVRYAADNGADVINMSLGTQPGTPAAAVGSLIEAVRYAEARGSLVVVAAGNSSVNLDSAAVYPANIEGPNMITVGASAPDETKASFSNYGSPVDVFAPGVLIVSTVPGGGYKFMNGTSMASPTVAGAAAAVLSAYPDLDPLGVREQLVGSADQVASYNGLAANPVRINQAWAVGVDGDPEVAQVSVSGLTTAGPEGLVATISMSDPGDRYAEQPYHWEASLVAIAGNQAYGIVDHALTVDWQAGTTDDRGAVPVASGGQDQARLHTELPPGTYGLIVEAVPDDDATVRLGDAFVSTFVVPAEPEPEPEPDPGDGGATTTTVPDDPTTTSPANPTSTTQPVGTTTTTSGPTTQPPVTGGPTTTAPTTTTWPATTRAWPTTSPPTTAPPPGGGGGGGGATTTSPATTSPTAPPTTAPSTTASPTSSSSTTEPPTTAPPTTAPPTTRPTTSPTTSPPTTPPAPSTTSAPAPSTTTTTGPPPTTTVNGEFAVYSISPNAGYVDQQTMVSIDGTFPSFVNVWFGDQPGDIIHHSNSWIVVVAPVRHEAGSVDVTLRSNSAGTVLLARDGFVYVDPTGGSGPTTTTAPTTTTTGGDGGGGQPTSTTTSSGGGGATSTTSSGPGGGVTSTTWPEGGDGEPTTTVPETTPTTQPSTTGPTTAPTTGTSAPATTTTTEPPGITRRSRSSTSGEPVDLGGGLRGVPLQGLGGLGSVSVCLSEPCRATRI